MGQFTFELDLPPGLNSDDTTFAAKGRWADGSNVRFRGGKPQTIGGWKRASTTLYTAAGRTAFGWISAGSQQHIAVASSSAPLLQVNVVGTNYNISPASWSTASNFSYTLYGTHLIVTQNTASASATIVEWDGNTANIAVAVANAPVRANVVLVTPERQLLALGCNEEVSTTFNQLCIRGSDIEDITDWTTTATNNAFEHILENCGTRIYDAKMVGSYVAVWTNTSLVLGQFVGDPAQTYRFDKISDKCGAFNFDTVTVVGSTAYWLGPDLKFWMWTIGTEPVSMPCPIWVDFATNLSVVVSFSVAAWYNPVFEEVWWHYKDTRDGGTYFSRYVAYSIKEGTWFRGQMANLAVGRGPAYKTLAPSGLHHPFTIDNSGRIVVHEDGNDADTSTFAWHIESADQYIESGKRRVMVRGIQPDFEDQIGNILLTVTVRDYQQGGENTYGGTLAVGADKKSFRKSGRIMKVKFSGSESSGTYMRLGKPTFDCVTMGER